MAARLAVEGLRVRFGRSTVVDDVAFEVPAGTTTALLGPSGSGKSTILRAVAGLIDPAEGRVLLDGVDVTGVAPERRGVGLMFQDYALFPHRDVGANVEFGLRMAGAPRADRDRRVAEVLGLVGLHGYERRAVASLSGGERQRVALARALAPSPRVILLDEPLGSLDRALRERLAVELRELFRSIGATVVTVTHDQEEAFTMADTIALLRAGQIVQVGPPVAVWNRPADAAAARFLGLANVFPVVVAAGSAAGPWGDVPSDRADGPAALVVRPDALSFGRSGPKGMVGAASFRGDHFLVPVDLEAGVHCEVFARASDVPPEGAVVRVGLDAAQAVLVDP